MVNSNRHIFSLTLLLLVFMLPLDACRENDLTEHEKHISDFKLPLGDTLYQDTVPKLFTRDQLTSPWTYSYFQYISWKNSLSYEDIKACLMALDSVRLHEEFSPNPMIPLLIHRVNEVLEKEDLESWEVFRKYFATTDNFSDQQYEKYLLSQIGINNLRKIVNIHTEHYRSIDDDLLNVLVIRQCKQLRNGNQGYIEIKDTMLNIYQRTLLEYSRMPLDESIDKLFDQILHPGPILSRDDEASMIALSSYGRQAILTAIKYLHDTVYVRKLEKYGLHQLKKLIQRNASFYLTKQEQQELFDFISREEIYKGLLNEDKSYLAFLKRNITGIDLDSCLREQGLHYDRKLSKILPFKK